MEKIVIAVDAMGGDSGAIDAVKGAVDSLINKKINIILVGKDEEINSQLSKYTYDKSRIEVVHASEVIEHSDTPTKAIKNKKDSSMVVGLNLVKDGRAGAFVSAGNTGALLTGATLIVGRIKGIERPALGVLLPHKKGYSLLIDCGANTDCKASYLKQFGIMGSVYFSNMLNVKEPKVAILNIGSEKGKGNELVKESYALLEDSNLNFIGNIESTEMTNGLADVVVCDAFVGNVVLKLSEGLTKYIMATVKEELLSTTRTKIGAAIAKPAFDSLKKKFDFREIGGAPFLGLKGLVIKAHGNSDAVSIKGAINQGYNFIENDIVSKIEEVL